MRWAGRVPDVTSSEGPVFAPVLDTDAGEKTYELSEVQNTTDPHAAESSEVQNTTDPHAAESSSEISAAAVPRIGDSRRVTRVTTLSAAHAIRTTTLAIVPDPAPPVEALHNGSFEDFYRRDYRSLAGLAYVMTGSQWLAEDLAQEAMTEAHRMWWKIGTYDDPGAWVRRVMVNKKISAGRRLRTEAKTKNRLRSRRGKTTVEIPEQVSEIWAAVCRLPTRQAQAIALFYWEDRPLAEIASIMEVGSETVKTHLKRGRAALAKTLPRDQEIGL